MKRYFLFILLLFITPTIALGADPLNIHDGGFGPSIDGLQLGKRMTWREMVQKIYSRPSPYSHIFTIHIAQSPKTFRVSGGGSETTGKHITINTDGNRGTVYNNWGASLKLPKQGGLEEYFSITEKNKMHYVYTHSIALYSGRIVRYSVFASDIKAPLGSAQKFSEWVSRKYNLGPMEKKKEDYVISKPSEGWQLVVNQVQVIVLSIPIPDSPKKQLK